MEKKSSSASSVYLSNLTNQTTKQSPGFHLGAVDEDPAPNQWAPIRGKGVADVQDVSSVMPFEGGVVAGVPPSP